MKRKTPINGIKINRREKGGSFRREGKKGRGEEFLPSRPSFLWSCTHISHAPPERGRAARARASREALSFIHTFS